MFVLYNSTASPAEQLRQQLKEHLIEFDEFDRGFKGMLCIQTELCALEQPVSK